MLKHPTGDGVRRTVGVASRVLVVRRQHAAACSEDQPVTKSTATGLDRSRSASSRALSGKPLPATAGLEGLKAWAATVNGEGGLQGHEVKIIVRDDGNDPSEVA